MLIRNASPEDARAIAETRIDGWRFAYRGIVPDDVLAGLSYDHNEAQWRRNLETTDSQTLVQVLENDEGRVIGFAASGPERTGNETYRGEVYAIYVRPELHGHGGGGKLLRAAVEQLQQRGYDSMLIWALADNPWKRFYEKYGGVPVLNRPITLGSMELAEIGYGWVDLQDFPSASC